MRNLIFFCFLLLAPLLYGQPDYSWLLNNSTVANTGGVNLTAVSSAGFSTARIEGTHSANVDVNSGNRFETNSSLSYGTAGLTMKFDFQNWGGGSTHLTRTLIDTRVGGTGKGLWVYVNMYEQRVVAVTSNGADTGSIRTLRSLWTLYTGQWVEVTLRFMDVDVNRATLWVNGVQSGTDSTLQAGWVEDAVMAIGCTRDGSSNNTFWGFIDHIQIYKCALSSTAIASLYTNRASYLAEECPGESPCDPIIGGTIATAQTIDPDDDVAAFTSSVAASGGSGAITYQWQYSTTSSTAGIGTWYDIAGATSATYNHGTLSSTTYFTRKAIDAVCGNGYSNVLKITVTGSTYPVAPNLKKWYFDSDVGTDFNGGHSSDLPLQTMAHLRSLLANDSIDPGDTVFFKKGAVWSDASLNFVAANSGTYGNEIVFTSYGSGNKPVFKGTIPITSYDSHVGNIWEKTITALPDEMRRNINRGSYYEYKMPVILGLFIDDVYYMVGKEPDAGFYTATSSTLNDVNNPTWITIADNEDWTGKDFSDGFASVASCAWVQSAMKIYSNSAGQLNFVNGAADYCGSCGTWDYTPNYRIINSKAALDVNGEHSYNHATQKLSIYYSGTLTDHSVEVTSSDTIINTINASYIKFNDLDIKGAYMIGVQITGGSNIDVTDCKIHYSQYGINLISDSCLIDGNEITDIHQEAISFASTDTCTFSSNIIKRIGMDYVGLSRSRGSVGISSLGDNDNYILKYNRIDSTSYSALMHAGTYAAQPFLAYGNMISNWDMYKADGAAMYFCHDTVNVSKTIRRNICFNAGKSDWEAAAHSQGIYLDAGSWHFTVDSNTVYNSPNGLYLHGHNHSRHHYIHDNLFVKFNVNTADYFRAGIYVEVPASIDAGIGLSYPCKVDYLDIKHNYIVATDDDRSYAFTWNANASESTLTSVGSKIDSNYYFNPSRADEKLFWYLQNWNSTNTYTVDSWFSTHAFEQRTTHNATSWFYSDVPAMDEDSVVWVFINASNATNAFDLGDCVFKDLTGAALSSSLSLGAYTAKSAFYVSGTTSTVDNPINDEFVEETPTPPVTETPVETRRKRVYMLMF
jgi:hypothetical protein